MPPVCLCVGWPLVLYAHTYVVALHITYVFVFHAYRGGNNPGRAWTPDDDLAAYYDLSTVWTGGESPHGHAKEER